MRTCAEDEETTCCRFANDSVVAAAAGESKDGFRWCGGRLENFLKDESSRQCTLLCAPF